MSFFYGFVLILRHSLWRFYYLQLGVIRRNISRKSNYSQIEEANVLWNLGKYLVFIQKKNLGGFWKYQASTSKKPKRFFDNG